MDIADIKRGEADAEAEDAVATAASAPSNDNGEK
jgi:hypothetical protein